MPKLNKPLLLSLSLCFLLLSLSSLLFAQNETLTITTYYPSPYGTYNQLGTNKLAVGYTGSSDQPSITGDMRLYPQSGSPTSWSAGQQGEVGYASTDGYLYAYNGSSWVKQGGSVVSYTYYCFSDDSWGTPVCTDAGGNQGFCLSGYTQRVSLGSWGFCRNIGKGSYYYIYLIPPGGSCSSGCDICEFVGNAYVCSN